MKIIVKLTWIFVFLFFIVELILSSTTIFNSVFEAINLWFYKVVPSLLPFFLFSNFLINYGFIEIMSELLKPIMTCFKINSNGAFIFVMSMLTGSPGNAFYINEALNKGLISEKDATKILMVTQFANPLFILGTINILINDFKVTLLILIITYLSNFILAFLFRNYNKNEDKSSISFVNIKNKLNDYSSISFGKVLSNSINKTFDTLIIILGSICFFYIITTIIKSSSIIPNNIYPYITGILEMTQGIYNISILEVTIKIKAFFITIFLSFGGFSIHSQVMSIINNTKIKYLPYLLARILHALVAGGLIFIIL